MPVDTFARVDHRALRGFTRDVFTRLGVAATDADVAAGVLVHADLLGIESHGVARLAGHPGYVAGLKRGIVNPRGQPEVVSETPTTALVDGNGGLGGVVSTRAMNLAIDRAEAAGVGMITVRNSRHFGIASHYAMLALPRGMIGLAMTNAIPQVVATGSKHAMLGTNPLSLAAPAGAERPFVLDMATSVGAAGKIEVAERSGKPIPDGWLVDTDGRPTTDPRVLSGGGALLPLGSKPELASYKGYGLAVVVDVLCGILSGAGYSSILDADTFGVGHFFLAMRIDAFRPLAAFQDMLDAMIRDLRAAEPAPGYERVYVHGEKELAAEADRLANGVPLHPAVVESLASLSRELGVALPTLTG
jgi:LDH2 family malate/lactate/ureidoglycolate dehydrogenase